MDISSLRGHDTNQPRLMSTTTRQDVHGSPRPRRVASLPLVEDTHKEKYLSDDDEKGKTGEDANDDVSPYTPVKPLPTHPTERRREIPGGTRIPDTADSRGRSGRRSTLPRQSALDWIVPLGEEIINAHGGVAIKPPRDRTVGERLDPTLVKAHLARGTFSFQAKMTGYTLNGAIGLQVVLGALTTGLSVVTTGHQTSVMTAILGGFATIVASYLAKARGSNEPEKSLLLVKDLEQFIRDCEAFKLDRGHIYGDQHDTDITRFRHRFEELLGNTHAEKYTTPPV